MQPHEKHPPRTSLRLVPSPCCGVHLYSAATSRLESLHRVWLMVEDAHNPRSCAAFPVAGVSVFPWFLSRRVFADQPGPSSRWARLGLATVPIASVQTLSLGCPQK